MKKEGNILLKSWVETPKKIFYDISNLDRLSPEELKVHLYLLNANENEFSPSVRWIQTFLGVSAGKAQQINKSLRVKGFVDLMPTEDGRYFVWVVNNVPLNVDKHKEFFNTKTNILHEKRVERNRERDAEIERLTRLLEAGSDDIDPVGLINRINELEREKE